VIAWSRHDQLPKIESAKPECFVIQLSDDSKKKEVSDPGKDITDNPHGPDPHGPDPHDEVHDKYMPANSPGDYWRGKK
jgi:hypothetical protein